MHASVEFVLAAVILLSCHKDSIFRVAQIQQVHSATHSAKEQHYLRNEECIKFDWMLSQTYSLEKPDLRKTLQ